MEPNFPTTCPACTDKLVASQLKCTSCQTTISGNFAIPSFLALPADEQKFIIEFILSSGSLKQMAQKMKLSYPTVRNYLDEIILKLSK